jgi:hypothetical protein
MDSGMGAPDSGTNVPDSGVNDPDSGLPDGGGPAAPGALTSQLETATYYVTLANPPIALSNADHAHMAALWDADIDIVSIAMPWGGSQGVEKTPATFPTSGALSYDFSSFDATIDTALSHGKKVAFLINPASFVVNNFTPDYVFSQAWATQVGQATPLDTCTCGFYPGGTQVAIASISKTNNIVSVETVTAMPHAVAGTRIGVSGVEMPANKYNGPWTISHVTDATHFEYIAPNTNAWAAGSGSAMQVDAVQCSRPDATGSHKELPATWEPAFKEAYKQFLETVLNHYSAGCDAALAGGCATASQAAAVAYIRLGLTRGAEANTSCDTGDGNSMGDPTMLAAPYTLTPSLYESYVAEMDHAIGGFPHTMPVEVSIANLDWDLDGSVAHDAAASHVGSGLGFGIQSSQASDLTSFPTSPCSGDWCALFDQYAAQAPVLHLQPLDCTSPLGAGTSCNGRDQGATGSAVDLLSFASRRMNGALNVYEFWPQDIALAYDPAYCVAPSGDTCGAGSYSNSHGTYVQYADAYKQAFASFRGVHAKAVDLSWAASPTAGVTYDLYRSTQTGGPYAQVQASVAGTSWKDAAVMPGTTYFYVVRAFDGVAESAASPELQVVAP